MLKIPDKAFPARGEPWTEVNARIANEWLSANVVGKEAELRVYLIAASASKAKDKTATRASFEYVVRRDELGNDWPDIFNAKGYRWQSGVEGTFSGETEMQKIAKLKGWKNDPPPGRHRRGDRVSVKGEVKQATISVPGNSDSDVALHLHIEPAQIAK